MNPRLRLALCIAAVVAIVAVAAAEIALSMVLPLVRWRQAQAEDRAAYARVQTLPNRAAVESVLAGWQARVLPDKPTCASLLRQSGKDPGACATAQEIAYRRRAAEGGGALPPLQIIVLYDAQGRALASTAAN